MRAASLAESVDPTPDGSRPDELMPMASDKPRWTEPQHGGGVRAVGECKAQGAVGQR